jgi:hypothetical protein
MSRLPLVEKSQLYQSALIMREVLVGSLRFSRCQTLTGVGSSSSQPTLGRPALLPSDLLKATAVAGVILMMFTTSSIGSRFFDECKKLRLSPRNSIAWRGAKSREPSEGACCADKDGTPAYRPDAVDQVLDDARRCLGVFALDRFRPPD